MEYLPAPTNSFRSPNIAVPLNPSRPNRHGSDRDEMESAEDVWSAAESGNELAEQNGSQSVRGLKRKRPVTVSYACPSSVSHIPRLEGWYSSGHLHMR